MSAEQKRTIEQQQQTIKSLQRRLSQLQQVTSTSDEVSVGDIGNHLSQILNDGRPTAIKRFGLREAYIVPAALLDGR